ncbi:hypothetical protein Tco_0706459 [Tanacetum coccineum]|uniref:Uncharacterized protein n=1 Tax=Tanacetum coccineum TaxID=301880 RepID=A0ABQ4Y7F2_9ASTR
MESVKKSTDKRALHKRESGNDTHANDADIRPIYDEEPMAEVQTTTEIDVFATGQHHIEQPEFNNEGEVDQNVEQCHDTCPLPVKLTNNETTELSNQSLELHGFLEAKRSWLQKFQFQMFIKSRIYLDDEYVVMTRNYFLQYTRVISDFHDTLIQHMECVKKSINERAQHKQDYDSWVNERQMQTTEGKIDTCKALDASLVDTESSGTELTEQDTSSRSGNDAHTDDADIKPIYDEEPMAEVQTTAEINIFAIGQQYTEQPEFNNEVSGADRIVVLMSCQHVPLLFINS